jgi:hypothetical protein
LKRWDYLVTSAWRFFLLIARFVDHREGFAQAAQGAQEPHKEGPRHKEVQGQHRKEMSGLSSTSALHVFATKATIDGGTHIGHLGFVGVSPC